MRVNVLILHFTTYFKYVATGHQRQRMCPSHRTNTIRTSSEATSRGNYVSLILLLLKASANTLTRTQQTLIKFISSFKERVKEIRPSLPLPTSGNNSLPYQSTPLQTAHYLLSCERQPQARKPRPPRERSDAF